MLKPPGANKSNENLSTSINSASKATSSTSISTKIVPPAKSRRSLNTSSRKSIGLNTSGIPNSSKPAGNITSKEAENLNRKGPTTRLSLVKPGSIQKPVTKAQQQTTESKSRTGPLKALPITSNIPEKTGTGEGESLMYMYAIQLPWFMREIWNFVNAHKLVINLHQLFALTNFYQFFKKWVPVVGKQMRMLWFCASIFTCYVDYKFNIHWLIFLEFAVKPALTKQMLLNPEVCTPVKADKKVQPKLLSTNFTTPVRSK